MLQQEISKLLHLAIQQTNFLVESIPTIQVTPTKNIKHGSFATNIALVLAKDLGIAPRIVATEICNNLVFNSRIAKVEIAGAGFINFFLTHDANFAIIKDILVAQEKFGCTLIGEGKKVLIEFISANPTGPLHVGHGRGAVFGSSLANIYQALGYSVVKEYYINDIGRQIDILVVSIWLRYLQQFNPTIYFPCGAYHGEYIYKIVQCLTDVPTFTYQDIFNDILPELDNTQNANAYLDKLIVKTQNLLPDHYQTIKNIGLNYIVNDIKESCKKIGIEYDNWFYESSLVANDATETSINLIAKHLYQQEGLTYFRSTSFNDDKDRVVRRRNGKLTYFATDIAYHKNKYARGFTKLINVWGSDHHGYVPRIKAALQALNFDPQSLEIKLIQFAHLIKGGKKISMSTRSGTFVSLDDLCNEIGIDALRFFYLMRRCEQHMEFDLDLAQSKNKDNPVYYVQYAYTRTKSVARIYNKENTFDNTFDISAINDKNLSLLNSSYELDIVKSLQLYSSILRDAATQAEPYILASYLRDLAAKYHAYYNNHKILVADNNLKTARFSLNQAVQIVIQNGLKLLNVSAPEHM